MSIPAAVGVSPASRDQFAAIAQLRWRIFVNSLRTLHGRLEAVSWIFVGLAFAGVGVGGTFGLAAAAWFLTSQHKVEWLTLVLWGVFLYWQLFPVMATAFTESFDSSNFLRFPIRYRSYFFVRMVYGALDPTTLIGTLWLVGMTAGVGVAEPRLFVWAALVLATFAVVNILLARAIFAWIERWLARRKSREILGIVFFLFLISFQLVGPVLNHYGNRGRPARPGMQGVAASLLPAEKFTPPGLVGRALGAASRGEGAIALGSWALECGYAALFFWVLDLRLRAQYRGENLSEGLPRSAMSAGRTAVREGLELPGVSAPVAAVFEKELHYVFRSGPMLFNLVMPLVILIIFMIGPAGNGRHPHAMHGTPRFGEFAFPVGVAYALLILSNLTYNCFGVEGGGIQFYFVAPVRFRQILLGKNLMHGAVVALETVLLWATVCLMRHPPSLAITLGTLAGALFAAFVNFTAGDLLSLYLPKKFDYAVFGRQRSSGTTALVVVGVEIVVIGIAALVFLFAGYSGRLWLAAPILLVFSAAACAGYALVLNHVDGIAVDRRENLIAELSRTQ